MIRSTLSNHSTARRLLMWTWVVLLWGGATVAFGGCDEPRIASNRAASYVDDWGSQLTSTFRERAESPDPRALFKRELEEQADATRESVHRDAPPYVLLAERAYRTVDYELEFVDRGGWTERGRLLWERLDSVQDHALDRARFDLHRIETLQHQIDHLETERHAVSHVELDATERRAAIDYLTRQPRSSWSLDAESYDTMTETFFDDPAGARLQRRLDALEEVRTRQARKMAALEQLMARNALRYARRMKHFHLKDIYVDPEAADYWELYNTDGRRPDRERGPFVADMIRRTATEVADDVQQPVAILHRRLRQTLEGLLADESPEQVLADLEPRHPQYERLKQEYDRYRSIVASGGWKRVAPESMGPGYTKPAVADLKRRLRTEGYFPDDVEIDETYGETLTEAVEAYQMTHQMRETGRPHDMFWSSLNVPADRRLAILGANLQRWRSSNVRHEEDDRYVLVNIPGAHAELWKEQQLDMRFRVVVGDGKIIRNEEEDIQKTSNRTPEVSAYIDRIIYNPYWNLTDRIRRREVIPKVRQSVASNYKTKLRELEAKLQEDDASGGVELDQFLVATDSSSDSSASHSASEASPPASASSDTEEASSAPTSSGGDGSPSESNEEENAPDVDISAYVRENDDGDHVFDVSEIRALIQKVRARKSSNDVGSKAKTDSTNSEEASPLEAEFPYLDPETGMVDVSSTDPDHIPEWYDNNDYEVISPGDDWEYVRMEQGPSNALGKVKVIFPNVHTVYLHDTPKKDLFSREIRAFSHGCMRMQDPFDLAEQLLRYDGQYDNHNISEILEGEEVEVEQNGETKKEMQYEYHPIFLDERVPVHVEYLTARVDDQGRAHFFSDVYGYDAQLLGDDDEG